MWYNLSERRCRLLNIIDTLSQGFNLVLHRTRLLLIPVALDLYLWLGPKLSIAPVVNRMVADLEAALAATSGVAGADVGVGSTLMNMLQDIQNTVGRTNLFALLSWGRLGMPSLASLLPINPETDLVHEIPSYGQMLALQLGIMALGLFITCLFLGLVAQEVRGERLNLGKLLRSAPGYWLHFVAIGIPLGILLFVAVMLSMILGAFAFLIWVALLWLLLYLLFVPQAITLADEKPLRAVFNSLAIMRLNFWPALGLFVLTQVIGTGVILLLRLLVGSPVGMAVAILLNAFIGTGLTAALFIFYRDRMALLHEFLRSQQQRSA